MLKSKIKLLLQKILGYENFLYVFAVFTVKRLKSNQHEKEFFYFLKLVPNDGVILDIGANIGVMTTALAMEMDKAVIYAFEPMPNNFKVINRVQKHFKLSNIKAFNIGLGEENGELKMVLPIINNVKMQGLSHVVKENDDSDWNKGEYFTVPVKKLDDIDELKNIKKIVAIKIDVENFEYYVFRGGSELLKKHKPIIYVELWTNEMRDVCLDYLRSFGYTIKVFNGTDLELFTNQADTNFFCIAK